MNLKELKKMARERMPGGCWQYCGVQKGFFFINGKERVMAVLCFKKEQYVTVLGSIGMYIGDSVCYFNRLGRI